MAASQVVLYFDKQEDALLFTLAASSVISEDGPVRNNAALAKIAQEISKASRITTEGVLDPAGPSQPLPGQRQ
ncbi:MAG TPA: hypothetical protein VMT28_12920 [Terriglobales bacterium]|jgi:hypothetical protein|nr:hypothetical protein [Terriglobales bacterium]